jgi:hypothetical protein
MAAISDTEPGPDGHGVSPREKHNTGKSISENRKKPAVFSERIFISHLASESYWRARRPEETRR